GPPTYRTTICCNRQLRFEAPLGTVPREAARLARAALIFGVPDMIRLSLGGDDRMSDRGVGQRRRAWSGPLVGREAEQAEIERLLSSMRSGLGGGLVLRGDAGIGKTALLDHAVEAASDMQVLRLAGIESEMELSYAGLHQLLYPFADEMTVLPSR